MARGGSNAPVLLAALHTRCLLSQSHWNPILTRSLSSASPVSQVQLSGHEIQMMKRTADSRSKVPIVWLHLPGGLLPHEIRHLCDIVRRCRPTNDRAAPYTVIAAHPPHSLVEDLKSGEFDKLDYYPWWLRCLDNMEFWCDFQVLTHGKARVMWGTALSVWLVEHGK